MRRGASVLGFRLEQLLAGERAAVHHQRSSADPELVVWEAGPHERHAPPLDVPGEPTPRIHSHAKEEQKDERPAPATGVGAVVDEGAESRVGDAGIVWALHDDRAMLRRPYTRVLLEDLVPTVGTIHRTAVDGARGLTHAVRVRDRAAIDGAVIGLVEGVAAARSQERVAATTLAHRQAVIGEGYSCDLVTAAIERDLPRVWLAV